MKIQKLLFLILLSLLLAGCGNEAEPTQATLSEATPSENSTTVEADTTEIDADTTETAQEVTTAEQDTTPEADTQPETETTQEAGSITASENESKIQFDAQFPFLVKVNRAAGTTTIYGIDESGEYSIPYKAFRCSVGNDDTPTPLGTFQTSDMYTWRLMVDGSYAQYAVRIYGQILLHSVCYNSMDPSDLNYTAFNQLGAPCSLGCIRFACGDIKWIYDNCPAGTTVIVYDDAENPGPLGKPAQLLIDENSPNRGWDPTDPNESNPWLAQ